ncbi:FAD-dependent oxidoreductase [Mycobacterium sp. URHB0044]|uniref:FAD-dependent oxidoreductase n=1 Tax=Mycobacterium sp. URHB0044 TaxID=1380386 RepID=UPI00048F5E77|nr:FAD-dependent oxidoreductase [Mycobacterium sp. URHB0044]
MAVRTVLIVGAGIAGSTAAHWLARHGLAVTVVERADGARSSGNPVDVRGPAVDVVERMGVLPRLRAAATQATRCYAVDRNGRRLGWIPMQLGDGIEIPRSDLATILADAGGVAAEFLYGDTVTSLVDDGDGVDVTFEHAPPRRFDIVIGADGLHSRVRELVFGTGFIEHLGLYVATVELNGAVEDEHAVLIHNAPARSVTIHPVTGCGGAAFIFRSPEVPGLDRGDTAWQREVVASAYAGMGWRVPELLELLRTADDVYFDSVSRVRLDQWSKSRIVLLGDAASCVSLFGEGSSLAIAGGATLADAITAHRNDPATALRSYERHHRRLVTPRQRWMGSSSRLIVPASAPGILARNAAMRLWPLVDAGRRVFGRR